MFYRKARLNLLRLLFSFHDLSLGFGLRRLSTIRRFVRQKAIRPGIDNTLDSRPLVPIISRTGSPVFHRMCQVLSGHRNTTRFAGR